MTTISPAVDIEFAEDVNVGLSGTGQKKLSSRFFYDALGSSLFEAITLLPEYGLTRADERLLRTHSADIARIAGKVSTAAELGSGSGRKTRSILKALSERNDGLIYRPIDVSSAALDVCVKEAGDIVEVQPVLADWLEGLQDVAGVRSAAPLMVLFLGSSIGNLERTAIPGFLEKLCSTMQPGDFFLLGADLVKDVDTMLAAYDDPTGVTAAFNLNLLARINRELEANFDVRSFSHEARWNAKERRVEMYLLAGRDQNVRVSALDRTFHFRAGETIWTESSHKFSVAELDGFARNSGFCPLGAWVDAEWPFANVIWRVGSEELQSGNPRR